LTVHYVDYLRACLLGKLLKITELEMILFWVCSNLNIADLFIRLPHYFAADDFFFSVFITATKLLQNKLIEN